MSVPSVYVLTPVTEAGKNWLEENLGEGQMWGSGYVVEWRFVDDILEGMKQAGLTGADVQVNS